MATTADQRIIEMVQTNKGETSKQYGGKCDRCLKMSPHDERWRLPGQCELNRGQVAIILCRGCMYDQARDIAVSAAEDRKAKRDSRALCTVGSYDAGCILRLLKADINSEHYLRVMPSGLEDTTLVTVELVRTVGTVTPENYRYASAWCRGYLAHTAEVERKGGAT